MKVMSTFVLFSVSALAMLFALPEAHAARDLDLRAVYSLAPEPLTTEKATDVDPGMINPHRARWALQRKVELAGLVSRKLTLNFWGVKADGLDLQTQGYLRGPGRWYHSPDDYDCSLRALEWFDTRDGAAQAAEAAARAWRERLADGKLKLAHQLENIAALTEVSALTKARRVFEEWVLQMETLWRVEARKLVQQAQRDWYAKTTPKCQKAQASDKSSKKKKKASAEEQAPKPVPAPAWETLMEPVATGELTASPMTRAPARRWNGQYSVRLTLHVGEGSLVGQFLIDSRVRKSLVSPYWLQSQGVLPALVEIPEAPFERVSLGRSGQTEGLARQLSFDRVELSGLEIPVRRFLLYETDLFGPPRNVSSCCDGILGSDFLSHFVVEFSPGPPAAIQLWPKAGFHLTSVGSAWVEAHVTPEGEVASLACETMPEGETSPSLRGSLWDTGSEEGMRLLDHFGPAAAKSGKNAWTLNCLGALVANDAKAVYSKQRKTEDYSVEAGMDVLGRGTFVMDLPHGRIWFSKALMDAPMTRNRSGLLVTFEFAESGDRVLKVLQIQKDSPAARSLGAAGLKAGMQIDQVAGKAVDELDLWTVEQILSGQHGQKVPVSWQEKRTKKQATLALPE